VSRRIRSRYPHCFSPGRGPALITDGSWRIDPRKAHLYAPRPIDGLMPPKLESTLSSLVTRRCGLAIRCAPCQRDKSMPPLEAVASYGGLITFDELKGLLRGRCPKADCAISVHATHNPYRTGL
jgi:hypothetical protein